MGIVVVEPRSLPALVQAITDGVEVIQSISSLDDLTDALEGCELFGCTGHERSSRRARSSLSAVT